MPRSGSWWSPPSITCRPAEARFAGGLGSRGDLPRDKALQLYTGNHWRVEAAILAEVEHFTRFAVRLPKILALVPCLPGRKGLFGDCRPPLCSLPVAF